MESEKHPRGVVGFSGNLDDLVEAIGNMSYDQVSLFLEKMALNLKGQAIADIGRKRPLLAEKLMSTAMCLDEAKKIIFTAWKICEPFMKDNK